MADTASQLKRKRESAVGLQKKSKKQRSEPNAVEDAGAVEEADTATKQNKKQRKQEQKDNKKLEQLNGGIQSVESVEAQTSLTKRQKQKHKISSKWSASSAQGGWFLPADPIFSLDEKHLILANPKALHVYTAETSLLARVLPVGSTGFVTAYALSSANPNLVYVADSNGLITLWNWVDGTKVGRWDIEATVRNMVVVAQPGSDEDLVYCHESGNRHIVNVHALRTKSHASKTELKQVLKMPSSITNMQVLLQGKYVVIANPDSVTVGKRLKVSKTAVQGFEYIWRELKFSKQVTACNTYFRQRELSDKGKRSAEEQRDILDLAVGDEVGVIFLFEDILASFAAIESSQKNNKNRSDHAESLRPKRLHWHREAVGSVKWSLDGNYVISGGGETVLTIWQLATGKPQHLPHLTAAIEHIVVSPSGSSYALSLANNSVAVLSTTELDAKTNIVGIQTRRVDLEHLPKEYKSGSFSFNALQPVPIAVDPQNAQRVLLTVPSSQPRRRNEGLRPEPYLQTFDIANQRPVARQALTRNNATDLNMGPDGMRIAEPNVKLLAITHDGKWLATVDEWLPPRADTGFLNEGNADFSEEERLLRREVYLKIWRRDEKNEQWTLETRIDAPHFLENVCGNGRVLDIVSHPTQHGFATIGEDQCVRIWKPKTRLRDGVVVRGAGNKGLVNWSLHRSIELPNPSKSSLSEVNANSQHHHTSRLAFSVDGSIIAAGVSGSSESDHGLIHLIDANSAVIQRSMTEIDAAVLCGIGIIDRYLVIVTDRIIVWDLVYDNLAYSSSISTTGVDRFERTSVVRLATNNEDGTFAVSLPQFEKNDSSTSRIKKVSSKVLVYSTAQKEPLWSYTLPGITLGLTARKGKGERGYITLDSVSCIRTISPTVGSLKLPSPHPIEQNEVEKVEDGVASDVEDTQEETFDLDNITLEDEYDHPVVTHQDFEEVFHNDNAPQTPKDVFSAVLRLFGGMAKVGA
ncbi:WD40-repeat-containing domain protein [Phaeosphaeriaceae sp. PMI808]|nr:WD40-repeat-containing domain protein [Phaeosphaeriaceae sp. PMI808]